MPVVRCGTVSGVKTAAAEPHDWTILRYGLHTLTHRVTNPDDSDSVVSYCGINFNIVEVHDEAQPVTCLRCLYFTRDGR